MSLSNRNAQAIVRDARRKSFERSMLLGHVRYFHQWRGVYPALMRSTREACAATLDDLGGLMGAW